MMFSVLDVVDVKFERWRGRERSEEIDARELMGMKASKEKISVVFTDSPS